MNEVYRMATKMVFEHIRAGGGEKEVEHVTQELISEAENKYADLSEEFLDEVFGQECRLDRKEWQIEVVVKCSWIFSPSEVRQKLYGDSLSRPFFKSIARSHRSAKKP